MQGASHELGASFPCQKQLRHSLSPQRFYLQIVIRYETNAFVSWNCTQKQSCVFLYPFPSGLGGGCHPSLLSSCGMKGDVCAHLRRTETQHRAPPLRTGWCGRRGSGPKAAEGARWSGQRPRACWCSLLRPSSLPEEHRPHRG